MNTEVLIALVNNVALLLVIAFLYEVLFFKCEMNTHFKNIIAGFFIGMVGIALMLNPWELSPGVFYDTRSILLSIVALFFGFIPAVLGALLVVSHRLYQGGIGATAGVAVTISSVILGLLWRQHSEKQDKLFSMFELYAFGILVHVVMLICMLLLPWPYAFEVLGHISLPVMLIYPIGTVLLGALLKNQSFCIKTQDALKGNELMLRSFINSVPIGMFRLSSDRKVLHTNPEMAYILGLQTPEEASSYFQEMGERIYVDPKRREELIKILKTQGHVENFEYEFLRADGNRRWLLMNVKKNSDPKTDSFVINGFVLDITDRKKAEEMLKQTERKYRDAYGLLHGVMESPKDIVIFALDREYRYLAFNENHRITMEQIWGAKIEVGISMLTYIKDPADREKAKVNFDRVLAGEAFTIVEEYGDSSLNRFYYSNTYSPLKDAEGDIIGITLILEDITSRKHAETELERSREQFRLAVDGSHDGIWDWDVHNNNLYLSSRCKEMIGYEDHELQNVYSIIENYIHPDDKQRVINDLEEYLELEAPEFNIEFRLKHRNGNYIWVQARGKALRDEEGLAYRMAGSLTDITERKKTEIKIAEEAVRRRVLIEQSSDGIVILDKDGKVFEANPKYAEMLGYSLEEVLSLHVWDWDAQFTHDELENLRRKVGEMGDHLETIHRRKDGTLFDVEISSNAAMFGDQKLIFCVCRDITERKRAEKELLHAKLEAESANRAKSQFIANMSHELRTPLTAVIGFSDILSMNVHDKLTEKEMGYIDHINKSGEHLLEIINSILDLSKIEAEQRELEREIFYVKEVIDNIVTMMTPIIERKNISIIVDDKIQSDKIIADKLKFKQIMYNLLGNAIKFTPDNGKVSVTAIKNDNKIQISVSDTGIGIPDEKLNDIFIPFMQVDESNKRAYGGTGLGLPLAKQFVEMHNGNIWVTSEEGKGSTFTFTIADQDIIC